MLPKRDWAAMTWRDFSGADTARWIAVLPVAAVEQHGPHLPLGVDAFISGAYLARVRVLLSPDLPVTFLPPQAVGISPEHTGYPGTLSISAATMMRVWTEMAESVHRAGVRKLVIVTSHGGNAPAMQVVARDLRVRLKMLAVTCGWHSFGYPEGLFGGEERQHGIHGGDIETSLMLAAAREHVRMGEAEAAMPATVALEREFAWLRGQRPVAFGWMAQDLHASGVAGDATAASAEKGEAALAHGARAFVELLHDVHRFEVTNLKDGPLDS